MQTSAISHQPSAKTVWKTVWSGRPRPLPLLLLLTLTLLLTLILSTPTLAQDKPVALKGGKLLTITHGTIDNGTLVMQAGKITAVGAASSINIPADAQVIDATGKTIYPGLIDSETSLGLTEISLEASTNDLVETSDEIMPHMHTAEAFHAESALIPVARMNGITNAVVAPAGADTLPGQDSFIQLAGANATEMLLIRDNAMPLNFTGNERRNRGGFEKQRFPNSSAASTQPRQGRYSLAQHVSAGNASPICPSPGGTALSLPNLCTQDAMRTLDSVP